MVKLLVSNERLEEISELVALIWHDVLRRPCHDRSHFLADGGDSLLATQFVTRLNDRLGLKLSPRILFDAPTPAELATCVRREAGSGQRYAANEPQEVPPGTTLSFSQERMWFMHGLAGQSAAYNTPLALRFRGFLDVPRLASALEYVVRRHPGLTTAFPDGGAGPVTRDSAVDSIRFEHAHLGVQAPSDQRAALARLLADLTGKPFDLARGPLLRATLVRIAADDAVLLLVMHHIVTDQWSLDLLSRELAAAYAASVSTDTVAPSPPSYERYAAWHRQWFMAHRFRPELEFWRRQLVGLEPVSLTGDWPRPQQPTFGGAKVRIPLEQLDLQALGRLASSRCASLAMILLAALNVLLYRHTGRTDIGVGVPIANRHHRGSEDLVGVLVNTLVARTDLAGNPDFTVVLDRTRAVMLDMFEHQDMPFELLVRELALSRVANRSPLFSVMFNMLNTPPGVVDFGDVACERLDFDKRASQFDLTVTCDPFHDRSICFEYSTDIFASATVERLAKHYVRILECAARRPETAVATLPMLAAEELELLAAWGSGPRMFSSPATVTQLVQNSFARFAQANALSSGDTMFTYEALDAATARIAGVLRSRGLGRGARVGLSLWRSPWTVIAQLGILRAGAAYVPLDASYPPERLAYIASDSSLRAVITETQLVAALVAAGITAELWDVRTFFDTALDDPSEVRASEAAMGPAPQDPGYVIYTSGSTGKPKGVEVPHAAVVNFLRSMAVLPGITAADRLLAVTTLSFDISVLELLLPLTIGAHVVIARRDQLADAAVLGELIESTGATLMQATPSTWRFLIDAGWAGSPKLRALVGGEPLSSQLARDLLARCREVWNMYGPTETTVWSTCWKVEPTAINAISIGSPIANTTVQVLDAALQLVPIGAAGELYIGGAGVATGYVNQPELTAQRFLESPLHDGRRLYRTGDRARWRHDGTLEHLGRFDSQVKIRGHRIELGEIEARLGEHPEVAAAAARVAEDDRGDPCIVAFVVPWGDMPEPSVFRQHLQQWLPSYMLPQYFVELDALPLLASGKVDKVGLAEASTVRRKARAVTPPRNEREAVIHGIWAELLGTDQFGVHENFFDLGGHSLLAVQVVTRVARELKQTCAVPMLFRYPTVASFSAALESTGSAREETVVELRRGSAGPPVFCVSGVELYQPLADRLGPRSPVYGLFSQAEAAYWSATEDAPLSTVQVLAADYVAALRARHARGPYVLAGFSFGGVIAYEMAQQLTAMGQQVPLLVILDSDPPTSGEAKASAARLPSRTLNTGARALVDLGRRLGGLALAYRGAADVSEARRRRYLTAMRDYRAQPYAGRALFVESSEERVYDPGHGWDALLQHMEVFSLPATHTNIFRSPHVDRWSRELTKILAEL